MKIYCSHLNKKFHKASNFYQCKSCMLGWYVGDLVPMVVIGYTEKSEVDTNYSIKFKEKDLSKKKFTRCSVCKDLLEKRKHILCTFKTLWKELKNRHRDTIKSIYIVILGFRKSI